MGGSGSLTLQRCNCRWDRRSSPSHPGGATRCPISAAKPAQVYAIDLNEAHLSLLKLKLAGLRAFSKYADFWQFFARAPRPPIPSFITGGCSRCSMPMRALTGTSATWSERPRHAISPDGFYRHGMLGRFIGLAHLLAKCARIDLEAFAERKKRRSERIEALESSASPVSFRRWLV